MIYRCAERFSLGGVMHARTYRIIILTEDREADRRENSWAPQRNYHSAIGDFFLLCSLAMMTR
ncbi:MAG: hypothetical protein AAF927_12480 [Bacteroidota bacterium]